MPKATKKKKDKAADFSRAKLKLGKGKKAASNVIDTSFKARSIALPSQSIAAEKDASAPTTKRKLTFNDLIAHLKHYNAATRRDALLGLRELFDAHLHLVGPNLTPLLNACVRIIGDEDASVRKGLLAFFRWLLPLIPVEDLLPHSSLLLLFTTSAQTHIFPEIRIDAIRFIDLFLEVVPDIVVAGWAARGGIQKHGHGGRVLEGYLGTLNAGTKFGQEGETGPVKATSTASVVLSPGSKLVVFRSLSTFLQAALSSPSTSSSESSASETVSSWYLATSFATPGAYETFDQLLRPSSSSSRGPPSRTWVAEVDEDTEEDFVDGFWMARDSLRSQLTVNDLSEISDLASAGGPTNVDEGGAYVAQLARTLQPTLVSTFLDNAPTVFSPNTNPPETELQMVVAVGSIARSLYGSALQGSLPEKLRVAAREGLQGLLGYMTTYFPFSANGPKRDIKIEQTLDDLNITFCELTSLLVFSSSQVISPQTLLLPARRPHARAETTSKPPPTPAPAPRQLPQVTAHITRLLRGEPPPGSLSHALGRPLSAQSYGTLLPTIWALINLRPPAGGEHAPAGRARTRAAGLKAKEEGEQVPSADDVLLAMLEHALRASSTSAVKRASIEFVGRLLLLETEPQYRGAFRVGSASGSVAAKVEEWLMQLPKTLWELGGSNPVTTETIFTLILRLVQRRSPVVSPAASLALRARLAPFFTISHAVRGRVPGPYAKLASRAPRTGLGTRRLALDLVATLATGADGSANVEDAEGDLEKAVDDAVAGTDEETYWAHLKAALGTS